MSNKNLVKDNQSSAARRTNGGTVQRGLVSADEVAETLRHRIQTNYLAPGERLREVRICNEFGVGRSVARRALRVLCEDGLVELEENRGARVSATTVEEVFDLYEVRAALYGLAARFACMRAPDDVIQQILLDVDQLLEEAASGASAAKIMETSENIFSEMIQYTSVDAQKMIASIRRKTRFHFSYIALAIAATGPEPYDRWRRVRAALSARNAADAGEGVRELLYWVQHEVARIMLSQGPRIRLPKASSGPRKVAN